MSVGQTILNSRLIERLRHVPGLEANAIVMMGATKLHNVVPDDKLDAVLDAYNFACTRIFMAACVLSGAQLLCACFCAGEEHQKRKARAVPRQKCLGVALIDSDISMTTQERVQGSPFSFCMLSLGMIPASSWMSTPRANWSM